jgi:hypothetical protein
VARALAGPQPRGSQRTEIKGRRILIPVGVGRSDWVGLSPGPTQSGDDETPNDDESADHAFDRETLFQS